MPNIDTDEMREGAIHPCNGYILVEQASNERASGLIVVSDQAMMHSAIVLEMSIDDTEDRVDSWEWKKGDLIFFRDSMEIDGHTFVHWTDVFAFRRFSA